MPQPRLYRSDADRQAAYRARCRQARQQQMEAKGLPPIPALPTVAGRARWKAALCQAEQLVGIVFQEMQDYYDERSQEWQESEKADQFLERHEQIDQIVHLIAELTQDW